MLDVSNRGEQMSNDIRMSIAESIFSPVRFCAFSTLNRMGITCLLSLISFFVSLLLKFSWAFPEIYQAVFLNPHTNSSFIRCPLDFTSSLDIQWYDLTDQRYDLNRGRYYRINGLQPFDRELICSSVSKNEKFKFIIRTYNRPLPVQSATISERTNTTLTVLWVDDPFNQNANITSYELILKYDQLIQSRIRINKTFSTYTFSSLHPSTSYSIDISVIDVWKRSSRHRTVLSQTLPFNWRKQIVFNQLIDQNLLDQSIFCYNFHQQFLLVEFNQSEFQMFNHIYNLTIFNHQDEMIFEKIVYSSLIHSLKETNGKYHIQLIVSTMQSAYLGKVVKDCQDFYPIYSPMTCSIRLIDRNRYRLMIYQQKQRIEALRPSGIFYRVNQSYFQRKSIEDIRQFLREEIIGVKGNYSIMMENDLLDEKVNISIVCPITQSNTRYRTLHDKEISNGMIFALLSLILILISLVWLIVYQKLCSFRQIYPCKLCHDSTDEPSIDNFDSIAIPIDDFAAYVATMHEENNLGFIRLFENLSQSSKNSLLPAKISRMECHRSKNRYTDILPYDHSRVKLSKNEYINANYVDGYGKINVYIGTQGPMLNTINDFWKMVWKQDVTVIMMITNLEEHGVNKCDVYWPTADMEIYGEIEVRLVSINSLAYYIRRTFAIRSMSNQKLLDHERLVHQFHYIDWPDHSVPVYPFPILSFIRHSSFCHSKTGGPIVVHCSAGVGRTGTYIVIDTMLKRINEQQPLNIPWFLKHIRQQRCELVQTPEQFIFIHDVLLEAVESLNTGYENKEKTLGNSVEIEKQFQLIQKQTDERWVDASYLHGYYRAHEFLITEHPMMNTRVNFWKVIWDNQTTIIVALYADEKLSSDGFEYWPSSEEMIDCGDIHVCLIEERFECEYVYRDCSIRSTKDNVELQVRIISTSYWPDACTSIETSFDLIDIIRSLKSRSPIVVHDHLGGHRAGTFCALYTMKEQIEDEGILNVYESAKFYYRKRPGIWRNSGDLLFLYRCAEILFRQFK